MKKAVSTHVFIFPFSWELKSTNQTYRLKQHKQMKKEVLGHLESWEKQEVTQMTDEVYNEYVYFYQPVLNMLYERSGKSSVSVYEKEQLSLQGYLDLTVKGKLYHLKLKHMELRLYKSGVGLLSFEVTNEVHKDPEDIMAINSLSKCVYPYCLPLALAQKDLFPESVVVSLDGKNVIQDTFEEDYKANPMGICLLMRLILGESFVYKREDLNYKNLWIEPLLGNRMFLLCLYANPSFLKAIKEHKIPKRFLNSFVLTSKKEKLLERENYLYLPKVVYGISRFSLVGIVSCAKESKLYNQLVTLVLAQKASLLHFSNQIATISTLPKQELVPAIQNLYEIYIQFISCMHFHEVTVDVQGSCLYNTLLKELEIEKEIREIDFEMQEIHEYAALIDQSQSRKKMDLLTIIGASLVLPTFVTGFFGMNIFKDQVSQWWRYPDVGFWFNSYVVLPVVVTLMVYTWSIKKSRMAFFIKAILLGLLLLSLFILSRYGCGLH